MRTPLFLLLSAVIFAGCDQQKPLPTGPYDKIDVQVGKTDSSGGGSSGDTTGTPTGDTTGVTPTYTAAQLLGPVTLVGGTAREILFFIASDESLHIIYSSDGANGQATVGRRTDWNVKITSPDSIYTTWATSQTDGAQAGSELYTRYWDLDNPQMPLNASSVLARCMSNSLETRTAAAPGAVLTIQVTAHSGIDDKTTGWTPPLLDDGITVKAIKLGLKQTSVTSTTFKVYMPGKTSD
jgi:hypothetical protein